MKLALIPFSFASQQICAFVGDDGQPWFIANEVAAALGYAIPKDAVSAHCKGAVKRRLPTAGGIQSVVCIPERDLYRLVMRSRLPAAEQFEEWVVGEVLPSIRKTGQYQADWRVSRHASASGHKLACDLLKMVRDEAGKPTKSYHYSNEARMVNWAMTDKFDGVDRDSLSSQELDLLAYLQERNAVLIGRGLDYDSRKPIIKQYAMDWRMAHVIQEFIPSGTAAPEQKEAA